MSPYIYDLPQWPNFVWNSDQIGEVLASVRYRQGKLLGSMQTLGFPLRQEAMLQTLTEDVLKSSEIEGEILDRQEVRSSVARRLGIEIAGLVSADQEVEGVVEMMLDATQNYDQKLTSERLFGWHAALFPTGRSGMHRITVGAWRSDDQGPMQVVSGPIGRERVHYQAPEAPRLAEDMDRLLAYIERQEGPDPVLKAGVAHLWFVTIHPFDDGNGRIGRAMSDLLLARSENSPQRFYSMSSQIRKERNEYYRILERAQRGTMDITPWMEWFLGCLERAILGSEDLLSKVLLKARFWERSGGEALNERQQKMINMLLDGFVGKLTSSKWATICKCSQDTASRDIADLLSKRILVRDAGGGRSTSYSLRTEF